MITLRALLKTKLTHTKNDSLTMGLFYDSLLPTVILYFIYFFIMFFSFFFSLNTGGGGQLFVLLLCLFAEKFRLSCWRFPGDSFRILGRFDWLTFIFICQSNRKAQVGDVWQFLQSSSKLPVTLARLFLEILWDSWNLLCVAAFPTYVAQLRSIRGINNRPQESPSFTTRKFGAVIWNLFD